MKASREGCPNRGLALLNRQEPGAHALEAQAVALQALQNAASDSRLTHMLVGEDGAAAAGKARPALAA